MKHATLWHYYPYCERSGTPLMYKAMPVWFRESHRAFTIACWPATPKPDGFPNTCATAGSASGSKARATGTSAATATGERPFHLALFFCGALDVVGSIAELESRSGEKGRICNCTASIISSGTALRAARDACTASLMFGLLV